MIHESDRAEMMKIRRMVRGAVAELALAKIMLDKLLDIDNTPVFSAPARLHESRKRDSPMNGVR